MKRHTPPYTGPRPTVVDAQRILRAIPLYAGHLGPNAWEILEGNGDAKQSFREKIVKWAKKPSPSHSTL